MLHLTSTFKNKTFMMSLVLLNHTFILYLYTMTPLASFNTQGLHSQDLRKSAFDNIFVLEMHWTVVIEMQINRKWNGNIIINIQKRNLSPVFQVFMITFFKDDMRINCLHRLTHLSNTITSIKDSISTDLADPKILRKIQQKGCLVMDVLFIIVKLIRIFYNILY